MSDLSNKRVLFWDLQGSYTHMAEAVVGDFAWVGYYTPWEKGFSVPIDAMPGTGLDGITRVMDPWIEIDNMDLVVFCDVGNGGLQEYLRAQGVPVFGSGIAGRLETDRMLLKSMCIKAGIDVADHMPVKGVDALREILLNTNTELWVKLSIWRGVRETWHHKSPFRSRSWLDKLSLKAGPYGELIDFVIEKPIVGEPCVEIGFDSYTADGMYPENVAFGYEAKDSAFALNATGKLPERLMAVAQKMRPMLSQYGYRGPLSTEVRAVPGGDYFVDLTARFPEPPSSLQRFMIRNWAEIFWEIANGRMVEPDYIAPYGVMLVMKSAAGAENPLAVQVERWDRTTLHGHCNISGHDYATSPAELEEFGAACGYGATLEAAMEDAIATAEGIEAEDATYDASALEELTQAIQDGNKLGLTWSGYDGESD